MLKRRLSEAESGDGESGRKCMKLQPDCFSDFGDELLLRIFSFLPIATLAACQSTSGRFKSVSEDSHLWRNKYLDRFVLPRLRRQRKRKNGYQEPLNWAHIPRWQLGLAPVINEDDIDWKRQYKIRHNWSQGACAMREIPLSSQSALPPLLARLHCGLVYSVDHERGLRAWSYKTEQKCLADIRLTATDEAESCQNPSALAVDSTGDHGEEYHFVAVGFTTGIFKIFQFRIKTLHFSLLCQYSPSVRDSLTAISLTGSYLVTLSAANELSVFSCDLPNPVLDEQTMLGPPTLLTSLRSNLSNAPIAFSLRPDNDALLVSVAFTKSTYLDGYNPGMQEIWLSKSGSLLHSRLATTSAAGYLPSVSRNYVSSSAAARGASPIGGGGERFAESPTSISYAHPYLLVTFANNTMALYMVHSSADRLTIGPGKRLWGHTSSVFSAGVTSRGKAVSVSARGGDVRVWELEGYLNQGTRRGRADTVNSSVQLTPDRTRREATGASSDSLSAVIAGRGDGLGTALKESSPEMVVTRGWVGFDEENVVVLRERGHGTLALTVYDFT